MTKLVLNMLIQTAYTLYGFKLVHTVVNTFRYLGKDISSSAFVFTENIGTGVYIMGGVFVDSKSSIGDYTYLSGDKLGLNTTKVLNTQIGAYCSIAQNFITLPYGHDFTKTSTYPFKEKLFYEAEATDKRIIIGNDVWIGSNVVILGGVTVGDGAVIGACSVVTKDVAPYAIVVGNPAKLLRFRKTEQEIAELEKLKWWNVDMQTAYNLINEYERTKKDNS